MIPQDKTLVEAEFMESKYEKMVELFKVKNVAYGDSFGKSVQKYGPIAALTRMSDKWNRIEALILGANNNVVDEKLEDTLVDMANYCLMTLYEIGMLGVRELDKENPFLKGSGEMFVSKEEPMKLGVYPYCAVEKRDCDSSCPRYYCCAVEVEK